MSALRKAAGAGVRTVVNAWDATARAAACVIAPPWDVYDDAALQRRQIEVEAAVAWISGDEKLRRMVAHLEEIERRERAADDEPAAPAPAPGP